MSVHLTVFVSGLNFTTSEETVNTFFSQFGNISSIKLPKFQNSENNLGYGHVNFEEEAGAQAAFARGSAVIDGRSVSMQPAKGTKKMTPDQISEKKKQISETTRTIFVKNLPYDITEDEVGDFFKVCGKIENVRFVFNPTTKTFKGFFY